MNNNICYADDTAAFAETVTFKDPCVVQIRNVLRPTSKLSMGKLSISCNRDKVAYVDSSKTKYNLLEAIFFNLKLSD